MAEASAYFSQLEKKRLNGIRFVEMNTEQMDGFEGFVRRVINQKSYLDNCGGDECNRGEVVNYMVC